MHMLRRERRRISKRGGIRENQGDCDGQMPIDHHLLMLTLGNGIPDISCYGICLLSASDMVWLVVERDKGKDRPLRQRYGRIILNEFSHLASYFSSILLSTPTSFKDQRSILTIEFVHTLVGLSKSILFCPTWVRFEDR